MKDDLILNSGPKVDPRDYPTIKCSKCGSIVFETAIVLKQIPGTIVGNGVEPVQYPLQVVVCKKCGALLDYDVKAYKLEKDIEGDATKSTTLLT